MSVDVVSLRNELREARRNLSEACQRAHATAVAKHLLASNLFENAQYVAVYLSCDGEVNLNPVIERLHSAEVPLVAPRIDGEYMAFFSIEPNMELARNRWGIQEPTGEQFVAAEDLSVALVPLVAFTADGDRLGRGGGYYDRYFADATTLIVGIAHELQRVPTLRSRSWDRRLDAVVTETGWRTCSRTAERRVTGEIEFSA